MNTIKIQEIMSDFMQKKKTKSNLCQAYRVNCFKEKKL